MKKIFLAGMALIAHGCTGTRPQNIGVSDGQLTSCPDSPNCVSTKNSDALHRIEPFAVKGSPEASMERLRTLVRAAPRAEIVVDRKDYMHIEFTSKLMRFVDDVEFFAPAGTKEIQIRSASRIGRKDFDVNRNRIENLRQAYQSVP